LDEHGLLDRVRDLGVKLLQIGDNLPLHLFDTARSTAFANVRAREEVVRWKSARAGSRRASRHYASIARRLDARSSASSSMMRTSIRSKRGDRDPSASAHRCSTDSRSGIENHDRFPRRRCAR
jgi:hypothetical protein